MARAGVDGCRGFAIRWLRRMPLPCLQHTYVVSTHLLLWMADDSLVQILLQRTALIRCVTSCALTHGEYSFVLLPLTPACVIRITPLA